MLEITVELGFLGKFALLSLKTCTLYHEKLFKFSLKSYAARFLTTFFQPLISWRLSEAVSVSIGMNARLRDTS